MGNQLNQFLDQKYINLETYKKDGTPIRTPVWFVIDNHLIYVITRDSTGKVKRLRNNHDVRIVSCSFKGKPKNEWVKAKDLVINEDRLKVGITCPELDIEKEITECNGWELKLDDLTLKTDNKDNYLKTLAFARIIGLLITDGHISKKIFSC